MWPWCQNALFRCRTAGPRWVCSHCTVHVGAASVVVELADCSCFTCSGDGWLSSEKHLRVPCRRVSLVLVALGSQANAGSLF